MGKIGYSSVTLTDLTETLPVTLVLETNLDQNIQTKVGNLYTPNFEEKELIITPSLFLGQEEILFSKHPEYLKPESETDSGYLYYEIGDTIYKWTGNFNSSIYVDDEGKLHIKENLTANTTIEAYIEDFYEPTHNYTVDLVSRVNPIDILFLEEGNDNYYAVIECSGGREHFEDTNANAITMTVKLYQGLINLLETRLNDFEIKWDKLSDGDNNADSITTQLTVKRSDITNRELFTCEIKDKATGITYTAQQFIYDFTDQYNCVITYDKPLLLSEENTEVNLSAAVWYKNERLEGKTGYKLSYRWMVVGEKDGEDKNLSGNESTIKISSNDINIPQKQAFTVLCQVLHTDSAGSQYIIANGVVTFQWIPSYSVRISPKDIFVVTGSDGSYQGNASKQYTFNFQLIDKQGNLINYDTSDNQSESISAGTNSDGTKITFSNPKNNKWDFTGTITLSNALWSSTDGSRAYEFTYVYYGQQFTEEINVIKNKTGAQGVQGIQGFSGYTVDLSNEFHAFSGGEGHADPDQSTSCKISAYFGSEGRTIQSIKLGSQIVYQLNTTPSLITYYSSDYGYLYIQAKKEQNHIIELTIRTNNSTTEVGKFLTRIRPLSFDVTILNTKNENLVFPKVFTYTINYNGKSYSLIPSHNFIKYSEAEGSYEPSSITVSATTRQESGESVTYSGAKILYSFNGSNWKNYTSSGISGYANLQNIYLRLYSSQANFSSTPTSTEISNNAKYLLDTETIPILTSLEGYQIGGENLLRWSKEMPVEINKWSQNGAAIKEKDGDFGVFKLSSAASSIFAPMIPFKEEMINNHLTFSCYVKVADWSKFGGVTFVFCINENFVYNGTIRQTSGEVVLGGNYLSHPSIHGKASIERVNDKWCKFVWTFKVVDGQPTDNNNDGLPDGGGFFEFADSTLGRISVRDANYCTIGIIETGGDSGSGIQIKKMKLEYGNISTEWSANPNDISYYDINGANLISEAKLEYLVQGTDNSSGYRIVSIALEPNTFYTLSWEKISAKNNCKNFTYQINDGNTIIETKNLSTSLVDYSITFQTGNSASYKILLYAGVKENIVSTEVLSFHKLKLEKGQISSPYTLTNEQLQDLLEKVKIDSQTYAESINKDLTITDVNGIPTITNIDGTKYQFTSYTDFQNYINELNPKFENLANGIAGIKDTDLASINGVLQKYEKQIQLHNENNQDPYIEIFAGYYENTNSMKLTKNKLSFSVNGTEVAYFSNNKMFITQADITTTLRIGTSTSEGGKGFLVFTTLKETGVTVTWANN